MRALALLLFALAACHPEKAATTAWPAPSTTADDGGQSIDPHPTAVAAAVESSEDEPVEEPAPAAETPAPAAAPAAETPEVTPTEPQPEGEVIRAEEIVIEIED